MLEQAWAPVKYARYASYLHIAALVAWHHTSIQDYCIDVMVHDATLHETVRTNSGTRHLQKHIALTL